jgi:four helix bundle protein
MFAALEVSYLVIKSVRPLVDVIERRQRDLADQILRAATSVSLNLAEGQRSAKGNKPKHYAIAHGSANEVKAGIKLALALGVLEKSHAADALRVLDRQLALLWRLTIHPSTASAMQPRSSSGTHERERRRARARSITLATSALRHGTASKLRRWAGYASGYPRGARSEERAQLDAVLESSAVVGPRHYFCTARPPRARWPRGLSG